MKANRTLNYNVFSTNLFYFLIQFGVFDSHQFIVTEQGLIYINKINRANPCENLFFLIILFKDEK